MRRRRSAALSYLETLMEIIPYLICLRTCLDQTTVRQMSVIVTALLAMSGRVTMRGIARWAGEGGSYRTVQRFDSTLIPWGQVMWILFRTHLWRADDEYLAVGDEVVVTKAGKQTHGLDRFFSSLQNRNVWGLAFFVLALVSVSERCAYPLLVEQQIHTPADKQAAQAKRKAKKQKSKKKQKGKPGRPKGSKNKDKTQIEWTPELRLLQGLLLRLLALIGSWLPLRYLVLDGHFGNNNTVQVVWQTAGLHLISKLRHDSALYFAYEGDNPKRKYGDKIDYDHIPVRFLKEMSVEGHIQTCLYQMPMRHKSFAEAVNVVVLHKTNRRTGATAHVVLFSTDLALAYDKLIDYYRLRFQIEFTFRAAKQYWGLEDFMNVTQTAVTNAVNLSFFLVNLSQLFLRHFRHQQPDFGLLDLKALFRGRKYAEEIIKLLPHPPDPVLLAQLFDQAASLGSVHHASFTSTAR